MNKQTVYSILMEKFHRFPEVKQAQDASLKELIGQIVLTPSVSLPFVDFLSSSVFSYNNETYRILDIAWDKDPTLSFAKRDGTDQSLSEYYRQVKTLFSFLFFSVDFR